VTATQSKSYEKNDLLVRKSGLTANGSGFISTKRKLEGLTYLITYL
jgi:hypothetical protein